MAVAVQAAAPVVPARFDGRCQYGPTEVLDYDLYYVTEDAEIPHVVAWLRKLRACGLDIETSDLPMKGWRIDRSAPFPFRAKTATLQLGYPFGAHPRAYVIDVRCVSRAALQPIIDILGSRDVMKLGMNIGFECQFFQHEFKMPLRNVACIQVAELQLRAGLFDITNTRRSEEGGSRKAYGETSMAALGRRHLGVEINKDKDLRTGFYRTPPGQHSLPQIQYAADDTMLPFFIARKQKPEIVERGLTDIVAIEFETIPVLADVELTGMGLDQKEWRALWQESTTRRAVAEEKLDDLFRKLSPQQDLFEAKGPTRPAYINGRSLNYDSPPHVQWALASYCRFVGWTVEVVTRKARLLELKKFYGADWFEWRRKRDPAVTWDDVPEHLIDESKYCIVMSTKKDVLKLAKIRKQLPVEVVDLLVEYSEQGQRADTFGIDFINKHVVRDTGRIHPQVHQLLASTGRLSTQPNSQNIPRDPRYRKCFKPRKGYKYVIADYSQIEPRLSAQVSLDPVYVATFLDDDDIYCRVCEAMTGTYPDKNTEAGKVMRQIFKVIVLALAYRMGPWKLRNQLTLALEKEIMAGTVALPSFEYARDLHQQFLEKCEKVKEYQDFCSNAADPRNGNAQQIYDSYLDAVVTYITAPCGRKRYFPPNYYGTYTEAPNAPIQGCSATITKHAAGLVQRVIDAQEFDAHIIDMVHDEIVWEVREDQALEFAPIAKRLMEEAGRKWLTVVPVKAEFPKGTNGVVDWWLKEAA